MSYAQAGIINVAGGGGGGSPVETLTGNTGGAVPPTLNNINVVGDGTTITIAGNPGTSTLTASLIQAGVTYYSLTPYIVGSDVHSQYTTISAAITAGTSAGIPFNVYVKPGTYNENLALVAGCNIIALGTLNVGELITDDISGNVIVTGGITFSAAGQASIVGITFTPAGTAITFSGSSVSNLLFNQCFIEPTSTNAIFNYTNSNSGSRLLFDDCMLSCNSGAVLGTINTNAVLQFVNNSTLIVSSSSAITNCQLSIYNSFLSCTSGIITLTAGHLQAFYSTLPAFILGTGLGSSNIIGNTFITTNTTYVIQYNSTTAGQLVVANNVFDIGSFNASPIQGTSTENLYVNNNSFPIFNASTQPPIVSSTLIGDLTTYNVNNTGATRVDSFYGAVTAQTTSYSVTSNDYFVSMTTTAAVTVTLQAAPSVGRTIIVKDVTGSGATNHITISGNGKNIDGSANYVINSNYGSVTLIFNGSTWSVI